MKKSLLLVAAAMAVTLLCAPMAYAAPSPTEPDLEVELGDQDIPLSGSVELGESDVPLSGSLEIGDLDVPLAGGADVPMTDEVMELEDEAVPLAYVPAPQTGVTGLTGMEALTLAAIAFAVSGALILAKARKQAGPVR